MAGEAYAPVLDRVNYEKRNLPMLLNIIGRELNQQILIRPQWKIAADYMLAGRYSQAEAVCLSLLAPQRNAAVLCTLSLIYLLTDRKDGAEAALAEAQDLEPVMLPVLLLSGDSLLFEHDVPRALDEYQRAISVYPADPYAYRLQATIMMSQRKYKAALPLLRRLRELTPDDDLVWLYLGVSLLRAGDFGLAKRELHKFAREHHDNFGVWYAYGNVLAQVDDLRGAERAFRRAVEIKPENADARVYLASVFRMAGKVDAAIRGYRKVIKEHPDHFTAWMDLGLALMDQYREDEANVAFERAYDLSPEKFDSFVRNAQSTSNEYTRDKDSRDDSW